MKHFNRLCATFVIACALSTSAFAGEMSAGIASQPPTPPAITNEQAEGEMSAGIVETAMSFLLSIF